MIIFLEILEQTEYEIGNGQILYINIEPWPTTYSNQPRKPTYYV